ncbi:MAG TPA: hypothetical protein VI300_30805 [Solirubrobacter sp.]
MPSDPSVSDLYTLSRATARGIDWAELLARAVVDGRGEVLAPEEERLAAVDELLSRSPRELVLLGELAAFISFAPLAAECRRPLARVSAGLIRLLERALAAHGRDMGYRVEAWRETIVVGAAASAAFLERDLRDEWPLPATIRLAAARIGEVLPALARDRLAVPELLADAAGELLVIYAAAIEA